MKILKIFSIATIGSFVGIGAATGLCAVISASANSHYFTIEMKYSSLMGKIDDTKTWIEYKEECLSSRDEDWHAQNDWKGNLDHYSAWLDENGDIVYGIDYYKALGEAQRLDNYSHDSNDNRLAESCLHWVQVFGNILIGLGIALLPSVAYLVMEKRGKLANTEKKE